MNEIEIRIKNIIVDFMNDDHTNIDTGDIDISASNALVEELNLDSVAFINLIFKFEEAFDIEFNAQDIRYEKFNSISSIASLIMEGGET